MSFRGFHNKLNKLITHEASTSFASSLLIALAVIMGVLVVGRILKCDMVSQTTEIIHEITFILLSTKHIQI